MLARSTSTKNVIQIMTFILKQETENYRQKNVDF